MLISDWSSDVCSSDLGVAVCGTTDGTEENDRLLMGSLLWRRQRNTPSKGSVQFAVSSRKARFSGIGTHRPGHAAKGRLRMASAALTFILPNNDVDCRSEEHTSELQSLMRISYAV